MDVTLDGQPVLIYNNEKYALLTPTTCEELPQCDNRGADLHPSSADGFVTTYHKLAFKGDEWKFVLEEYREKLYETVRNTILKLLDVSQVSVFDIIFSMGSLAAVFSVHHSPDISGKEINKKILAYNFEDIWLLFFEERKKRTNDLKISKNNELYKSPSLDKIQDSLGTTDELQEEGNMEQGTKSVTSVTEESMPELKPLQLSTSHEMLFHGVEWRAILQTKKEELLKALTSEICEVTNAIDKPRCQLNLDNQTLFVKCTITHPTATTKNTIDHILSEHGYPSVWSIYEKNKLTSKHEEHCKVTILEDCKEDDKSQKISVKTHSTETYSTTPTEEKKAETEIIPTRSQPKKSPKKSTSQSLPLNNDSQASSEYSNVVTRHRVRFDGDVWGLVVKHRRAELERAFDTDVCDAVGIP
ncbi:uncharacterized protein TM35_000232390, partial [Trypanosoma theileri]